MLQRPTPRSWRALAGLGLALLAATFGSARAQETAARRAPAMQRLVLAHYYYDFQGDPRKPLPQRGLRGPNGASLLTHHPWESVGPWMSYDRARWHRSQLQRMAASGIDVALVVYRGDRDSRRGYALRGLRRLVDALKELRGSGPEAAARPREFPLLGLALDLDGLAAQHGGPVDLRNPDVRRSLYGMLRDFFRHVPEEFRATLPLPPARRRAVDADSGARAPSAAAPGAACIVRLLGDNAVREGDASVLPELERRFFREFGTQLVWIGTPALHARLPNLDGVAPFPAADRPASVSREGWIATGSFGPGADDAARGDGEMLRPRENGQRAIEDFKTILDAQPDWLFVDSWNGFARGTEIAPTLEHGLVYCDLLRAAVLQFKQSADYAAHILQASIPPVVQPGHIYQVEVAVQNSGTSDWDVFNVASLSYRWRKDGEYVGDPGPNVVSAGQARGQVKLFRIGLAAPIAEGRPLPPGDYELELGMTRRAGGENVWFESEYAAPYRLPVRVGPAPEGRVAWLHTSLPTVLQAGAAYPVEIALRNDGSDVWRPRALTVGYRWRRVSSYLHGASEDRDTLVGEGKRVPIEVEVPPGRMVTLTVPVSATLADGRPLPLIAPEEDDGYVLEWDLHDGRRWLSEAGAATCREPVEVVQRDVGVSFVGCSLGGDLVAGREEKITVGLLNIGPNAWKAGRDRLVVHWFYLDGTEASWNDTALPLPEDVPPFSERTVQVPVDPNSPGAAEAERADAADRPERERRERRSQRERRESRRGEKRFRTERLQQPLVLRDVPVRVPYYFGPMYCVLDFQYDGRNASTLPGSRGHDLLVVPVNVFSPTFTPMPIAGFFNVDGISPDVDRADGNIDGRGNSLPAELLPPYVPRPTDTDSVTPSPLYPSGLWVQRLNDLNTSRVCFMYPGKANGQPNMIRCEGQRIPVGPLYRTAVHLLAVCTDEDVSGEFVLYYTDGTSERKRLTFTHWNDPPKHGERIGFLAPHRHTAAGDDPATRCYVNHYTLPTDQLKPLAAIELPRLPAVKVLAITLESATLRGN